MHRSGIIRAEMRSNYPTWRRILALRIYQIVRNLIFDPIVLFHRVIELPSYSANLVRYRKRQSETRPSFRLRLRFLYPVLGDRHAAAGTASGHYFHQDIWAASHIHANAPERHVDVGSQVAGFVAHLLCFRSVEYVDVRPLQTNVRGLKVVEGDLRELPYPDGSLESVSSLHVVEHVGLGRYGDPVEPDGWNTAAKELKRVLRAGGLLYFSCPVGAERVEFDAHRVFHPHTVVEAFSGLRLLEFAYVNDAGDIVRNASLDEFHGWYCCGLFLFVKA